MNLHVYIILLIKYRYTLIYLINYLYIILNKITIYKIKLILTLDLNCSRYAPLIIQLGTAGINIYINTIISKYFVVFVDTYYIDGCLCVMCFMFYILHYNPILTRI